MTTKVKFNIKHIFRILFITITAVVLSSCSAYKVNMESTSNINRNINGIPSSTAVYIYQLTNTYNFKNASYADLANSKNNLDGTILMRTQVILLPGQSKTIYIDSESGAKYIGVVTGYRELDQVKWREVYPISDHFYDGLYRKSFTVNLTATGVSLE
ncbi:type VI secretion system lipoprotein TssJ [Francisellaceae bacterium]|nr:type VI secretion system lipoprotein TssJ [Francisellaceae bacterium]